MAVPPIISVQPGTCDGVYYRGGFAGKRDPVRSRALLRKRKNKFQEIETRRLGVLFQGHREFLVQVKIQEEHIDAWLAQEAPSPAT